MTNTNTLTEIKTKLSTLKAEQVTTQEQIKAVESERATIYKLPIRLEDFKSTVALSIERAGKEFATHEMSQLTKKGMDRVYHKGNPAFSKTFCLDDIEYHENKGKDILWNLGLSPKHFQGSPDLTFSLLCRLMPNEVTQTILSAIDESTNGEWDNDDLSTIAERKEQIKKLDQQLINLKQRSNEIASEISAITDQIQSVLS